MKQLRLGVTVQALFSYHLVTLFAGLLAHPYKTVQEIVRHKLPTTSIFVPTIAWVVGFLLLRILDHFLIGLIPYLGLWWFLFVWETLFLLFWQILLIYLFFRFSKSLR